MTNYKFQVYGALICAFFIDVLECIEAIWDAGDVDGACFTGSALFQYFSSCCIEQGNGSCQSDDAVCCNGNCVARRVGINTYYRSLARG